MNAKHLLDCHALLSDPGRVLSEGQSNSLASALQEDVERQRPPDRQVVQADGLSQLAEGEGGQKDVEAELVEHLAPFRLQQALRSGDDRALHDGAKRMLILRQPCGADWSLWAGLRADLATGRLGGSLGEGPRGKGCRTGREVVQDVPDGPETRRWRT